MDATHFDEDSEFTARPLHAGYFGVGLFVIASMAMLGLCAMAFLMQ